MKLIVNIPEADQSADTNPTVSNELWRSTVEQAIRQFWPSATVEEASQ